MLVMLWTQYLCNPSWACEVAGTDHCRGSVIPQEPPCLRPTTMYEAEAKDIYLPQWSQSDNVGRKSLVYI